MSYRLKFLFLSSFLAGGLLTGLLFASSHPESGFSFRLEINLDQTYSEDKPPWTIPDFGPDGLKGLTEEQKKRLFSEEVVIISSDEGAPEGQTIVSAALTLRVPVEKAWAVLSATERQVEYLEEIEELKTIEQAADQNRMEFTIKIMGQKVRYTVIHHFVPEKYYFWWELDSSVHNDLRELFGFWRLYPAGDKTIARYGSYVRLAFPVPDFIRNWLYKRSVHTSLEKVKKFVERAGGR